MRKFWSFDPPPDARELVVIAELGVAAHAFGSETFCAILGASGAGQPADTAFARVLLLGLICLQGGGGKSGTFTGGKLTTGEGGHCFSFEMEDGEAGTGELDTVFETGGPDGLGGAFGGGRRGRLGPGKSLLLPLGEGVDLHDTA